MMATIPSAQFAPPGGLPLTTPVGGNGITTLGSIIQSVAELTEKLTLLDHCIASEGEKSDESLTVIAQLTDRIGRFSFADFYIDESGFLRKLPLNSGVLPSGLTVNGRVFVGSPERLPTGLSSNGGVIMTDGSVFYPHTVNNGGVLMTTAGAVS